MTIVDVEIATDAPNQPSFNATIPLGVSGASGVAFAQPLCGCVYMYAAPAPPSLSWAPAMISEPEIATEWPSSSDTRGSAAVSLAVCVALTHPPVGSVYTYIEPLPP